ncbi:LOW QUALITY PROTEIN: proline-rich protein 4-like [Oryza brachyantha]|uniref:LOW QUALITY PROTEIN: proline-rich protein 4-like n=1 Tax=Oryza brachyantha TaxID=4533 RepID=UPI0003EAC634|nr:LOW QUALITY PROTEIN: proline-rich protein 4-like [Oryza brachyantha]
MEIAARQLLLGACAVVLVAAHAAYAEAAPIVVGSAMCSGCTRKNMNAEAAFKGLQVAVKCKNSRGEYESVAMAKLDKSGAFSAPLATNLVGEDGELKQDCFARLHGASNAPCPGQEPSEIVAAQPGHDGEKTFVALGGKVHSPSAECASVFLCHHFHKHHPIVVHPPVVVPPKHETPVTVPDHKPPVTEPKPPEHKPPSTTPVDAPPIYHPPAQQNSKH